MALPTGGLALSCSPPLRSWEAVIKESALMPAATLMTRFEKIKCASYSPNW